jgi:hypothetical protein
MADAKIILSAQDNASRVLSGVRSSMAQTAASAAKLGTALAGIALGAGLTKAITSAADYADEMGKLAERTGVAVEALSALTYAAKLSDVSQDELAKGLQRLSSEIDGGGKKLKEFGITSKTADGALLELADRFKSAPDGIRKTAAAADLLGDKLGPKLIPLLNQGSAGIRAAMEEAKRFGVVVDKEAAASAAVFNDNLERLKTAAQGASIQIAGPLIQSLGDLSSYFLKVAKDAGTAQALLITFGSLVARGLGVDDIGRLQAEATLNATKLASVVKQIEREKPFADLGEELAKRRIAELTAEYERLQRRGAQISALLRGEADAISAESKLQSALSKPIDLPSTNPETDEIRKRAAERLAADMARWAAEGDAQSRRLAAQARGIQMVLEEEEELRDRVAANLEADMERWIQQGDAISRRIAADERAVANLAALNDELDRLADRGDARKRALTEQLESRLNAGEVFSPEELDRIVRGIGGISDAIDDASKGTINFADVFESRFESAILKGEKLSDVLKGLAMDLAQLTLRESVTKPLAAAAGSYFRTALGFGFADGGVMTSGGPLPLKAYSKGGIASSPQVALFGEGSMPEAYVPLPDGRRIPVAMKGGGQSVTIINHMTVGDVASMTQVQAQLRESERRIASNINRSMRYGGAMQ